MTIQVEPQGHVLLVDGELALVLTPADADPLRAQTLALAAGMGLGHAALLCGTLSAALSHRLMAARKLANHLLHSLATPALSIAEDVSGMPTLAILPSLRAAISNALRSVTWAPARR